MDDVEQKDTPIKQRPRYVFTTCQKCQIPGHHERDHHKLQHYHDTIIHYARRYHGELQKRQRRMNNLAHSTPTPPSEQITPSPATTAPSVTRTPTAETQSPPRFFRQE